MIAFEKTDLNVDKLISVLPRQRFGPYIREYWITNKTTTRVFAYFSRCSFFFYSPSPLSHPKLDIIEEIKQKAPKDSKRRVFHRFPTMKTPFGEVKQGVLWRDNIE